MNLFPALHATWPAAATWAIGPYTLRDGAGGGGRASAATLDGPFADPSEAAAAMARPLFMIRAGDDALDTALAGLGYLAQDPTLLMAAPAASVAYRAHDLTAILCEAPLAAMAELWSEAGIGPARLAVMARVPGPKAYLLGRLDDRPVGTAFVALHAGVAMLHSLAVAPAARRRRLGARISQAAAAWALTAGAETFALAVEAANAPARALYAGLGLADAGSYHYRTLPEETPP